MDWTLVYGQPFHKLSLKSVLFVLRYPGDRQTDKQPDKQTDEHRLKHKLLADETK